MTDLVAQPASPPAAPADDSDDTPAFKVVAIGDGAAGKTNFLAMLYQHLSGDPDSERGYHLSTDMERRIVLDRQADQAASPGMEWAQSTEWVDDHIKLSFQVPLVGGPAEVLHILYTDYPGEYLRDDTAGNKEQRESLRQAIAEADAMFMLVDGERMLNAFQGGGEHEREFSASLRATVAEVQRGPAVHRSRAAPPLQVLITKWDLLVDAGFTLEQARDALVREKNFRGMLVARDKKTTQDEQKDRRKKRSRVAGSAPGRVRIIPVSVLGPGAVELVVQDLNGVPTEMRVKREGFLHRPINLDVPLAAILPDRLDQILADMSPQMRQRAERRARWARFRANHQGMRRLGGQALETTQEMWGSLVGMMLLPWAGKITQSMLDLLSQQLLQHDEFAVDPAAAEARAQVLRRIGSQSTQARSALLEGFAARVRRFEQDFSGWDAQEGLKLWRQGNQDGAS